MNLFPLCFVRSFLGFSQIFLIFCASVCFADARVVDREKRHSSEDRILALYQLSQAQREAPTLLGYVPTYRGFLKKKAPKAKRRLFEGTASIDIVPTVEIDTSKQLESSSEQTDSGALMQRRHHVVK